MIGLRFSLVLDFGMGAAARARHGIRRREDSAQRMKAGMRAAASYPVPALPAGLGWGPLEPEDCVGGLGEPEHNRGARQ